MLYHAARYLYSLLLYLLTPLIFIRLWWRGRLAPGYRKRWRERLGILPGAPKKGGVLIHAVSVGEAEAAKPFVQALLKAYSSHSITMTCMTPTGSARIKQGFADKVFHSYLPYDWPCALKKALRQIEPKVVCIMETELWPNLLYVCEELNIPVLLLNGRLSERSARGYQRWGCLTKTMFRQITHIAAQSKADAERYCQSGALASKVSVTGNIKYDIKLEPSWIEAGQRLRQAWQNCFVVIAASTHEGEEALILPEYIKLKSKLPHAKLILVPRHPERFEKIHHLILSTGLSLECRSQAHYPTADTDVFLGDSMGELMSFYAAADVAFVGGSLVETGGHNPLEPAIVGVPVVMGPHRFNFADISKTFLAEKAMLTIRHSSELCTALLALSKDTSHQQELINNAKALVASNQGATQKNLNLIESYLN